MPGLHGAGRERGSRPPHAINMSSCEGLFNQKNKWLIIDLSPLLLKDRLGPAVMQQKCRLVIDPVLPLMEHSVYFWTLVL